MTTKPKADGLFAATPANPHPAYEALLGCRMEQARRHLNSLWQWYLTSGLADDHFLSEFPIQTRQRIWELETAWFLDNCGFTLSSRRAGSDFRCASKGFTFEVEAVAPGPGATDNPDRVNEISLRDNGTCLCSDTISLPERERIELLRLTSAIDAKAAKHVCDMKKGASDRSLPFVIALSPLDMSMVVGTTGDRNYWGQAPAFSLMFLAVGDSPCSCQGQRELSCPA